MTEQQVSAGSLVTTQASYPITPRYSLEQLLAMGGQEIIDTWGALPAVSLDELQGHFMGLVPNGDDPKRQAETAARPLQRQSLRQRDGPFRGLLPVRRGTCQQRPGQPRHHEDPVRDL